MKKEETNPHPFFNPEKPRFDIPGVLNTLIKRKMRVSVTNTLKKKNDHDFAESHWEHFAGMIIKAHMAKIDPTNYKNVLTDDQLAMINETYEFELIMLSGISKLIDAGKTFDQIKSFLLNS